jgi:hypothetical protein
MRLSLAVLAAIAAITTALPMQAPAQPLADPEAKVVEELVVQAVEPGPAWWRVVDGDTTVYVLAVADDEVPADLAWDQRFLERRIKGANSLILGVGVGLTGGVRDLPALIRARSRLKSKTPMEDGLPPPLRARFVAARERAGQPAKRYAGWQPLIAGEMLQDDLAGRTKTRSVVSGARALAKQHKVRLVQPARYPIAPFLQSAMSSLTPALHQQCLTNALDDADAGPGRARAALQGWARGDTAAALNMPRGFDKCVLLVGGGAELWRRSVSDLAGAIQQDLAKPGHAVAVVNLRLWLAEDGLATQLKSRGVRVLGPGEA